MKFKIKYMEAAQKARLMYYTWQGTVLHATVHRTGNNRLNKEQERQDARKNWSRLLG